MYSKLRLRAKINFSSMDQSYDRPKSVPDSQFFARRFAFILDYYVSSGSPNTLLVLSSIYCVAGIVDSETFGAGRRIYRCF